LNPDKTHFFGPMVDTFFTQSAFDLDEHEAGLFSWIMRIGRAIFDRHSGEFIGCLAIDILLNRWTELIIESLAAQNNSNGMLVRASDGIVVAGGIWSIYGSPETVHATEVTEVIGHPAFYDQLMDGLDQVHHHQEHYGDDQEFLDNHSFPTDVLECITGEIMSVSVLPGGDFVYFQAVGAEIFDVIDQLDLDIDQDVIRITLLALLIGGIGMVVLMIIVWTESMILTRPLNWMQEIAWSIVNHADSSVERQSLRAEVLSERVAAAKKAVLGDDSSVERATAKFLTCTPKTEITELVNEFKLMIRGFSGAGKASSVAQPMAHEIRNMLVWQSDFQHLYSASKGIHGGQERTTAGKSGDTILDNSVADLSDSCEESQTDGCRNSNADEAGPGQSLQKRELKERLERPLPEECFKNVDIAGDTKERRSDSCKNRDNSHITPGASHISGQTTAASEFLFRSVRRDHAVSSDSALQRSTGLVRHDLAVARSVTLLPTLLPSTYEWTNEGRNLKPSSRAMKQNAHDGDYASAPLRSRLFRWILLMIVLPMALTYSCIACTISRRVMKLVPKWTDDVRDSSFEIQLDVLNLESKFSSLFAQTAVTTPVRDLFVFTRVAGWLYADALKLKTDAFIEMGSGSEECKLYEESCPWYSDSNLLKNAPCDCDWLDQPEPGCFRRDEASPLRNRDTRWMQKLFHSGKRTDADVMTGRRGFSSYPRVDTSAANTSWWHDLAEVPGAPNGNNASAYETTFDRLRTFSALSLIIFPLYNYRAALYNTGKHKFLGTYFGFEADGLISGWAGCSHPSTTYPHFQSTEANGAFKVNATLCPEGSFGYDARCRNWYDGGKKIAQKSVNKTTVYVTPPYEFASSAHTASSVTQAVVDPRSGELVGHALVDFMQNELLHFNNRDSDNNLFLITPNDDAIGNDVVFSRGKDRKTATDIGDLMLPYDHVNSSNRMNFDKIVGRMKEGKSCLQNFTRTTMLSLEDGSPVVDEETIWVAYNPVHIRALDAVQGDDYSRGLRLHTSLVYSLGVGRTSASIERPFQIFKDVAAQPLTRNLAVYIAVTTLISLVAMAVVCRVSVCWSGFASPRSGRLLSPTDRKIPHICIDIFCCHSAHDHAPKCCEADQCRED
jgi:hypothetical protein